MGKVTVPIDKLEFIKIIQQVEQNQTFPNRSKLFEEISKQYCRQMGVFNVTPSVVYLRCREWNIELKTPIGKRGRHGNIQSINRQPRSEKFSTNISITNALTSLRKITPDRFLPVAKRVKNGSMKAAIQLKCLDCSDYQTIEIRNCECKECSLWAFRPYQGNHGKDKRSTTVKE